MSDRSTEKNVRLDVRLRLRRLEQARERAARDDDVRRVEAIDLEIDALKREPVPPV